MLRSLGGTGRGLGIVALPPLHARSTVDQDTLNGRGIEKKPIASPQMRHSTGLGFTAKPLDGHPESASHRPCREKLLFVVHA